MAVASPVVPDSNSAESSAAMLDKAIAAIIPEDGSSEDWEQLLGAVQAGVKGDKRILKDLFIKHAKKQKKLCP